MPATREICKLCGDINRIGYHVPSWLWNEVAEGRWNILCLGCFTRLADEKGQQWDKHIDHWAPVSFVSHQEDSDDSRPSAFWSDLAEDLKDPDFRKAYLEEFKEMWAGVGLARRTKAIIDDEQEDSDE